MAKSKSKSRSESRRARGARDAAPADGAPRLSAHPRARRQIRAAKAWSALAAFLLVQIVALHAGMSMFDAGIRALAAGVVAYVLAWGAAVLVWRQVAVAELESVRRRVQAAAEERRAASA